MANERRQDDQQNRNIGQPHQDMDRERSGRSGSSDFERERQGRTGSDTERDRSNQFGTGPEGTRTGGGTQSTDKADNENE